jgi:hypothetical protein
MEHDLSENRSPLFRIMLMDGRSARPRFSFVCAKSIGARARGVRHRGPKCGITCGITCCIKCGLTIILSRPARCVPSPQRGEGQDEGVRDSQNNLQRPNPLTPSLSPLGRGRSFLRQLLRTFMACVLVLAALIGARVFLRANENGARASKIRSREARNRSGPRKGRGGA